MAQTTTTAPARPHEARGVRGRAVRIAAVVGATALTGYVARFDPDVGGVYPPCPSRTLFGVDCPACGGLRGTNALLHGRVGEALDHNLLLPVLLAGLGVAFAMWLLPVVGRPSRAVHPRRWLVVTGVVVAVSFTLLRNLPIAGLEFLASGA